MIVLTGGAGFIGSNLIAALNAAGREDILVVDSLRDGEKWKNLVGRSFIDIVSKEDFREQMITGDVDDVDTVLHFGACSTTTERDADYLLDNNTRYSQDIAEFAFEHKARFIYASSAATYGDGGRGYSDDTVELRPLNMYGYSKHLFDVWIRKNNFESACAGLKLFNVCGPNEYHKDEQASMAYKAFQQIQATGSVRLFKSNDPNYSDGGQMRDFVYVKDVCNVVLNLMNAPDVNGIFNVGSGTARTWNDLVNAVFMALERNPSIEYIDMPDTLSEQYQNFTQAEMSKLTRALPSIKFSTLEFSISDYVSSYLQNSWQNL